MDICICYLITVKFRISKQIVHTAKKFFLSLCIFFRKQSTIFRTKINRIMAKYYANIELKLYFKCSKRLFNLFHKGTYSICVKIQRVEVF